MELVWGYGKGSWGELARGSLSNVSKDNPVQIAGAENHT